MKLLKYMNAIKESFSIVGRHRNIHDWFNVYEAGMNGTGTRSDTYKIYLGRFYLSVTHRSDRTSD